MAKDPAFLFYSGDFIAGTQFFTDEQVGKYIKLLCAQHLHGHLSEKHMIIICKSYDNEIWEKFEKDADGLYFNERMDTEILRRKAYSLSRSNNKAGKVKAKDEEVTQLKNKKNSEKSYDNHMETKTITKTITKSADEIKKEKCENFKIDAEIYIDEYGPDLVKKFVAYWTEGGARSKKLRWEKEPVFEIKRRLDTFRDNAEKWDVTKKASGSVSPSKKSAADERHNDIINSYDDGNEN